MADNTKADEYVFDRSYIDNTRLNLQHKLWVDIFGYLLHPDIPTSKEDLKVADIGTGTGIWLTDLARTVPPTATLDGFDISLTQAEPLAWFPSNITLREWDIMSDVPADLVGKYDVVHLRLLIFVIPMEKGPREILKKLVTLLKPGGYLQWSELDPAAGKLIKTDPSNSSRALEECVRLTVAKKPRMQPTWVKELSTLFEEVGLQAVKEHKVNASERDNYFMHECNLLAYEMLLGSGEEMRKVIGEAVKETRKGTCFEIERICVVGRKAVD